jgi:CheY-like chemotaxis protein
VFCDLKSGVILVAEDNPDDAVLLCRALKKAGFLTNVHVSEDGEGAIAYLAGSGEYADRAKFPFPCMLITDLKMPLCDGFELLDHIQKNPDSSVFPRIVLSASREQKDVIRAFHLGAHCYFCKPGAFEELVSLMTLMREFWTRTVLPSPRQ